MAEDIVLTPSGKSKVEAELERLRSIEMPALSERIRQARALGDLSENFDYQDAKRHQGFVAGRIKDLEMLIDRAQIVPETQAGTGIVGMGSTVTVRDHEYNEEIQYTLVGVFEADPANDRISASSPVGKALMGRKVGDTVQVVTPGGTTNLEVIGVI